MPVEPIVSGDATVHRADCRDVLPTLEAGSIDAIITDPPYPEIDRPYGRLTESEWWDLMMAVCREARRILKPTGSAVFILQPNSRKFGSMRGWLWEFMAWACREWNMVQDAWWWRFDAMPTAGAPDKGLMRSSLRACVWCGPADCYRDQGSVLWAESEYNRAARLAGRCGNSPPAPSRERAGTKPRTDDQARFRAAAGKRGGVTPFNVLPVANGSHRLKHSAPTPLNLADWWTRYISPPGGTILDPFAGSGTMGCAALDRGRKFVGIESFPAYWPILEHRLAPPPLFASRAR